MVADDRGARSFRQEYTACHPDEVDQVVYKFLRQRFQEHVLVALEHVLHLSETMSGRQWSMLMRRIMIKEGLCGIHKRILKVYNNGFL